MTARFSKAKTPLTKHRRVKPLFKRKYEVTEGNDIGSLEDAMKVAADLKPTPQGFAVYRGQSNWAWVLRPKVFRKRQWYRHEREMIRELISIHPQEFTSDVLMLDRLVRMQHYGLPTRLLDITTNFLAALYFACDQVGEMDGGLFVVKGVRQQLKYFDSDAVSLVANLCNLSGEEKLGIFIDAPDNSAVPQHDKFNLFPAMDRLLQFVRNEKPYFRSEARKVDLKSTFCVMPKKNNRRIIAQSGAFLVFGLVGNDRNPDLASYEVTRHRVPYGNKGNIRSQLQALGINESSLFPELDHAAKVISEQFARSS